MSRSDSSQLGEARRLLIARFAMSLALITVLASDPPSRSWLLAIAVCYALVVTLLLWRRSQLDESSRRSVRTSLLVEALMFTLVLNVLDGLQTPLVGLYGLLVLIAGLAGGSRAALQVGAVSAAAFAGSLAVEQALPLPGLALRAHLAQPGPELGSVLRDWFLWVALVGTMVFATAMFSEQVRERAQRAEGLYRSLFSSAHEPIVVYDPRTREILDVNPAAVEVAGRPREELIGRTSGDFLPRSAPELGRLAALDARYARDTIYRYLRPDREERIVAVSPPAQIDGGATLSVSQDVTDAVRRAEEQRSYSERLERTVDARTRDLERTNRDLQTVNRKLRELQGRLVEAQNLRALESLAAFVAHSVNNPLQALLGTIELEMESNSGSSPALQRILSLAKRIQHVVVGSLDQARRRALELRPERPEEILLAVCEGLRERARLQSVRIQTKIEPDAPTIQVDRALLISALASIAENALEAMLGGGELELRLEHEAAAKAVCFSIADTGPGIPGDMRCKVLEPFFTTKFGGSGLGLAIANGIVQGHQGAIRIEKAASGGALVQVQLRTGFQAELDRGAAAQS